MPTTETSAKPPAVRWGAERRLEFIDFRLQWEGTINRGELVNFLGFRAQTGGICRIRQKGHGYSQTIPAKMASKSIGLRLSRNA